MPIRAILAAVWLAAAAQGTAAESSPLAELGEAVFNTQWVVADTPRAQRRDGLGPVFNAASCDACHNNGARGAAPEHSGELPASLVIQLAEGDGPSARYGHVLNPIAIEGFRPEGKARVIYEERAARYPDGQAWSLRVPRYELHGLRNGLLHPGIIIKPRIAPALFGIGLLEAVPQGAAPSNRFGWQADSASLEDQTSRALSREMGLSSTLIPHADCGAKDEPCIGAASGGSPEVSEEFMQALLAFQRGLEVPRPPEGAKAGARARGGARAEAKGAALFASTGCAACHRPQLPVEGIEGTQVIHAFTDLERHDMGPDLADRDALDRPVKTLWRTAPLWGSSRTDRAGRIGPFLHDGRARSVEEAVLWHGGEAQPARERFTSLKARERKALLAWVASR